MLHRPECSDISRTFLKVKANLGKGVKQAQKWHENVDNGLHFAPLLVNCFSKGSSILSYGFDKRNIISTPYSVVASYFCGPSLIYAAPTKQCTNLTGILTHGHLARIHCVVLDLQVCY